MKIQPVIPQLKQNNEHKQPEFTGAFEVVSSGLRFLDTNQAWGANGVDLCSMVIPRTTVDFVNRGPQAGTETARREACGTVNHSLVGMYGTLAGLGLASMFNSKFGIRADKIFADNNTIDILSNYWENAKKSADNKDAYVKKYVTDVADNIKFFNTDKNKDTGFSNLSKEAKAEFIEKFSDKLLNSENKLIDKDFKAYLHSLFTSDTGAETKAVLSGNGRQAELSSKTLISNIYNVSKTFLEGNVEKLFDKENASKALFKEKFVNGLKSLNRQRSIVGLGIATALGMSIQPYNIYLTKKKTGTDGFVGVAGRKKDNSGGFKFLKGVAAAIFAVGALSTITINPKKFLSKIQFQGMSPTVNQLKLVYGLTISSRFLAARDKDELRESAVKDTLGFLNLLVLGALVTKAAARGMDKSLINSTKSASKNFFSWIIKSSLKTRDEVLYEALNKKGIKTVKDGKAIPFKELIGLADKDTKAKLNKLNIAQVIGYLYSGLVLGVGIPKLNIYMTNKSEAKRKAKMAEQGKTAAQPAQAIPKHISSEQFTAMMRPENLAFLSKNM